MKLEFNRTFEVANIQQFQIHANPVNHICSIHFLINLFHITFIFSYTKIRHHNFISSQCHVIIVSLLNQLDQVISIQTCSAPNHHKFFFQKTSLYNFEKLKCTNVLYFKYPELTKYNMEFNKRLFRYNEPTIFMYMLKICI